MSVLAGSDWDEDGIKASPGVAGVCKKTGIKYKDDISAVASPGTYFAVASSVTQKIQVWREERERKKNGKM